MLVDLKPCKEDYLQSIALDASEPDAFTAFASGNVVLCWCMRNGQTKYLRTKEGCARITQLRLFNKRYLVALDESKQVTVWDVHHSTKPFSLFSPCGTLSAKFDLQWYTGLSDILAENEGQDEGSVAPPHDHAYIGIARCNSSLFVGVTSSRLIWAMVSGEVVTERHLEEGQLPTCVAMDGSTVCVGIAQPHPAVLLFHAIETTLIKELPIAAAPKCMAVAGNLLAVQYENAGLSVIQMDTETETNNFHILMSRETEQGGNPEKPRFMETCRVNGDLLKAGDTVFKLDASCVDCQMLWDLDMLVALTSAGTVLSFDKTSQKVTDILPDLDGMGVTSKSRVHVDGDYVFVCAEDRIRIILLGGLLPLEPVIRLTHSKQEVISVQVSEMAPTSEELLVSVVLANGVRCKYGFARNSFE